MSKRKSVVLQSDSDSDEDVVITNVTKKSKSLPKDSDEDVVITKVTKKSKPLPKAARLSEDDEEVSPARPKRPSMGSAKVKSTERPSKAANKRAAQQKNTLDNYFSKKPVRAEDSAVSQAAPPSKKAVTADDYFTSKSTVTVAPSPSKATISSVPTKQPTPEPSIELLEKAPSPSPLTTPPMVRKHSKASTSSPVRVPHQGGPADAPGMATTTPRTPTHDTSPNENAPPSGHPTPSTPLTAEERVEHLKKRNANFMAFKSREGPQALGSRQIPVGSATCLKGLTFVVTGVLESVDRDDLKAKVENMGGKVTGSVSKRTSYLVVGRDPGVSKITKATELNVTQLDEDGLFTLLEQRTGQSSTSPAAVASPTTVVSNYFPVPEPLTKPRSPTTADMSSRPIVAPPPPSAPSKPPLKTTVTPAAQKLQAAVESIAAQAPSVAPATLWVDKYRPRTMQQLVGQFGPKSCANKLLTWLQDWHKHLASGAKAKGYNPSSGWGSGGSDDGIWARAALLSGPPGIGKTTTVEVVCRTLGFSAVELNASDQRNKRSLKETVAQSLHTHSLTQMLSAEHANQSNSSNLGHRHCLVMDEVDGMAGNEDRGGMQELLQLIKTTRIPVICMCNDRQSQKVRSLANYCLDLRFQRPRVEQIKGLLCSIGARERISVPPEALNDIIVASNQDIRQVINNLQMWKATDMKAEQLKSDANSAQKDLRFSPFDVVRKVFLSEPSASIHDKIELFFQDYNFGPLFVQENYLNVRPLAAHDNMKTTLQLMSRTADAIALGDVVSRGVRSGGDWSLLPVQAVFSSLMPGEYYRGPLTAQIGFPSWLGKNSSQGKTLRLSTQLCSHMRLSTHGSCQPRSLILDYVPVLSRKLTLPLREGDVSSVLSCVEQYDLLREDMDSLVEMSQWPNTPDRMSGVDSKVKAALTRAYNKSTKLLPYALSCGATSRAKAARGDEAEVDLEEAAETIGVDGEGLPIGATVVEDEETENGLSAEEILKRDAMIVCKKNSASSSSSVTKKAPSTSKPKATGGKAKTEKPAAPRKRNAKK